MHELSFPDKRERPPLQTGMATPVCSALTGVTLDMELKGQSHFCTHTIRDKLSSEVFERAYLPNRNLSPG